MESCPTRFVAAQRPDLTLHRFSVMVEYQSMGSSKPPAVDELKLAMAAANHLFNTEVFGNRNLAALDQIYTSDARILPPGAPMVSGREAIKQFWSDLIQS